MKKTLIAMGVLGAFSSLAFAASNVTLYGVIEEGVMVSKAKHKDTTVQMKSGFDQGPRWGIKGVEDLGNGYNVGFILEQGFSADTGAEGTAGKAFNRESFMYVNGGFGKLGVGRTGALSSGAQSNQILTGWALGTGYMMSAWNSMTTGTLRMDNAVAYNTPSFDGFSLHAMYSNGIVEDTAKWSENNHYYGIGAKYQANAIRSSLIFEAIDNKGAAADVYPASSANKRVFLINYGLEYNLGSWTPMFAYQWFNQDEGKKTHQFGLSAKVGVAGGDVLVGGRYLFGHDESVTTGTDKVRAWNVGAAYVYPLSKRTAIKAYAGYADSSKAWADKPDTSYNGYAVILGLRHSFSSLSDKDLIRPSPRFLGGGFVSGRKYEKQNFSCFCPCNFWIFRFCRFQCNTLRKH